MARLEFLHTYIDSNVFKGVHLVPPPKLRVKKNWKVLTSPGQYTAFILGPRDLYRKYLQLPWRSMGGTIRFPTSIVSKNYPKIAL